MHNFFLIISHASTTDTSLLTVSYLISLQIAKCKKPYSIGGELIKPSLIAACNEVLGQSAVSKIKDIPLWNDTVERRISDMAEDTETLLIEKIKKSKLFALQLDESTDIQNSSILVMYVRYIDHDESDVKEDILSVSELPTHTTSSETVKVLNGFTEERGLEWKTALEFVLTALPVLQLEIQVWSLKLRIWRAISYCQRIATFIGKTWPPKQWHLSLMKSCLKLLKLLII